MRLALSAWRRQVRDEGERGRLVTPATPESKARTRAFARVIGPILVAVPSFVAAGAPEMSAMVAAFIENRMLVWIAGGLLTFGGLLIIAYHQYWSSPSAAFISLFGWIVAIRGAVLLVMPRLIAHDATGAVVPFPFLRLGFGVLFVIGIWLTFVGWTFEPAAPSRKITD